jgi:peptide/nickel transport system ATP-binding protein
VLLDAILPPTPGARPRPIDIGTEPPNPVDPPPGCPFHPRCAHATDLCKTVMPPATGSETAYFRCHNPLADIAGMPRKLSP